MYCDFCDTIKKANNRLKLYTFTPWLKFKRLRIDYSKANLRAKVVKVAISPIKKEYKN